MRWEWVRFVVPIMLAFACIFTLAGTSWCQLVRFSNADWLAIEGDDGSPAFPADIYAGYWGVTRYLYVKDPFSAKYTYKINACLGYVADETVMDSAFYAGRVFSTLTPIIAIFVCIFTCFFTAKGKSYMKCMSYLLLLTTLCSGLMLLIFSSKVCNTENWGELQKQLVQESTCQMGPGAGMIIACTVLYFISAVLVFLYARSPGGREEENEGEPIPGDAEAGVTEDKPAE
eukprot:CAMPEP_0194204998 /NCGR_PEP_ID=MMETSP0156-20130528/4366_1 /TAXON_ID=33649 /ORGANISM="Thalassionema nitzschioides, Strain L26-B" /LENGTH=229 /DNA_ID=CAMNT_0038931147 /DNA_START=76 /DNA_END=765 /DNA_ORIENTATION=+